MYNAPAFNPITNQSTQFGVFTICTYARIFLKKKKGKKKKRKEMYIDENTFLSRLNDLFSTMFDQNATNAGRVAGNNAGRKIA